MNSVMYCHGCDDIVRDYLFTKSKYICDNCKEEFQELKLKFKIKKNENDIKK
jgi:hypothetical protein